MDRIKVYELDFGEQNLISMKVSDILGWIESEISELSESEELNYTIKTKYLTAKEFDELPEWGG